MPIQVLMPALSPTMTDGTLARWMKAEGDQVEPGDVLAEIETDKATMEVEAIDGGKLAKIIVPGGTENVPVNAPIGVILEDDEDDSALESLDLSGSSANHPPAEDSAPQENQPAPSAAPQTRSPNNVTHEGRILASPLARRLAQENHIALDTLTGSGPRGRIVQRDIQKALDHRDPVTSSPQNQPQQQKTSHDEDAYEIIKLSGMRKVIASRLTESKQTVPHFYLTVDCLIDDLLNQRKMINQTLEDDQKISVNDFVLKAMAKALKEVPDANASFGGDHIRRYRHADLSVAVAVDGGLLTPVIKRAETLSLLTLSQTVKQLVQRARSGKLSPEEYQGGSFSVSNLGMYGIKSFSAIINAPQGGILAVGAGAQRPTIIDGEVRAATVMSCTLSADHRVIDGAVGAQLLAAFKKFMEHPLLLML